MVAAGSQRTVKSSVLYRGALLRIALKGDRRN